MGRIIHIPADGFHTDGMLQCLATFSIKFVIFKCFPSDLFVKVHFGYDNQIHVIFPRFNRATYKFCLVMVQQMFATF